ncbi:MAG: helix-turn-helix domain-containing protein [Acidiferrobacteraceae bacterium]
MNLQWRAYAKATIPSCPLIASPMRSRVLYTKSQDRWVVSVNVCKFLSGMREGFVGPPGAAAPFLSYRWSEECRQVTADKVEVDMLRATLLAYQGNVRAAAKALGVMSRALHQKLQFHQIDSNYFRAPRKLRTPLPD